MAALCRREGICCFDCCSAKICGFRRILRTSRAAPGAGSFRPHVRFLRGRCSRPCLALEVDHVGKTVRGNPFPLAGRGARRRPGSRPAKPRRTGRGRDRARVRGHRRCGRPGHRLGRAQRRRPPLPGRRAFRGRALRPLCRALRPDAGRRRQAPRPARLAGLRHGRGGGAAREGWRRYYAPRAFTCTVREDGRVKLKTSRLGRY